MKSEQELNKHITYTDDHSQSKKEKTEQIQLKDTRYYQLINVNFNFALYISSGSEQFTNQKAYLSQPDQTSLGQIWQIIRIPDNLIQKNRYEIVHTRSTLVLTKRNKNNLNQVKLKYGERMSSQLFLIQFVSQDVVKFISYENPQWYLHYDKYLKVGPIDKDNIKCLWKIKVAIHNPIINRSCYFQNAFSNLIIDVPKASLKQGCSLIQYTINNRFNQRFNIFYDDPYFKIQTLNSKLFLTAHKHCRQGDKVTQQRDLKEDKRQLWIIQYQGRNLYAIRSVLCLNMMIGIKQGDYSDLGSIITSQNDNYCQWKIIGYLPQRRQLSLS